MIATRTQDVYVKDIYRCMRGWPTPLKDKTMKNELVDVEPINFPSYIKNYKEPGIDKGTQHQQVVQPCSSFIYSAFVAPGHHQFLIYIPERTFDLREDEPPGQLLPSGGLIDKIVIPARLFCKSIIINISSFDHYLTIPIFQKGEVK
jgi:hypothetical protein